MSVINTNITSMIGQQNLRESQNALTTSMERLSSGLRINSAKDDAAGQAIANRMTAQITGLNQASRNANDGISVSQTAEGALNQINDNVQRIRELTVQSANGTNSQSDLNSIQDEINQRIEEIDRVSKETDFNGTKVLAEGVQEMDIQVGANDNEVITIAFEAINSDTLGIDSFSVNGPVDPATTTDADLAKATTTENADLISGGSLAQNEEGDFTLSLNGDDFTFTAVASGGTAASGNVNTSGGAVALTSIVSGGASGAVPTDLSAAFDKANLETSENGEIYYKDGEDFYAVEFEQSGSKLGVKFVDGADAQPVAERTENPLSELDSALSTIDSLRSELGAVQNRFGDAITNLDTNSTNLSDARSRIEDADYATEVANMTRAQILQQAGTSVLAQANQIPQSVLSLLG
ncbi:FliC/FljB family flagellin [Vreelandella rituensis]|uniref:Flagellin n=1 Tax=Vreelandella rituensis TaxID=2282306 RepID=A0A368UAW8_9GAMM|nr:FliC/FljB family flagellin [Halomonas rituensis]RCV93392.1 FliC/FljB family flagellin [Halomonas rituensis]